MGRSMGEWPGCQEACSYTWSGLQGHERKGKKCLCKGRLRCRYHSCRPQEALCFELRRRCSKASAMIWLVNHSRQREVSSVLWMCFLLLLSKIRNMIAVCQV